jgi:hypothetical protein
MQNDGNGKNFLEKNLKNFGEGAKVFDFTYHKLHHMLDQLWRWDPSHPDVLVVNNILELYIDGEVEIHWMEGYPLPYPTGTPYPDDDIDEIVFEELYNMSLEDDIDPNLS